MTHSITHGLASSSLYLVLTVNQQKAGMGIDGRMKQRKGEGSFNPMLNGKLVHSVLSGRDNRQEGWARWYEDGAKQLNLVETRYKEDGQVRGDRRYVIPAHYVHKDVISINDKVLLTTIGNHIKGLQGQGMAPEQIKADLSTAIHVQCLASLQSQLRQHTWSSGQEASGESGDTRWPDATRRRR